MARGVSIIVGIGLAIVWLVGLGSPGAAGWMTWLDGVGALLAFGIAAGVNPFGASRVAAPIALSVGLFALWIIGLASGNVPWMNWWTFVFACVELIGGIAAGSERGVTTYGTTTTSTTTTGSDRFRRSA